MTIPMVAPEEAQKLSADIFGRMRSPWNVLDRKYLARGLGEMCGIPSTDFCEWIGLDWSGVERSGVEWSGVSFFVCSWIGV